jgi:hypothetical protein
MNGQYPDEQIITVSLYAFKKDSTGERHGSATGSYLRKRTKKKNQVAGSGLYGRSG